MESIVKRWECKAYNVCKCHDDYRCAIQLKVGIDDDDDDLLTMRTDENQFNIMFTVHVYTVKREGFCTWR